jgi:pimeloyl-ACP methyl ester carboxylesterase
MNDRHLTIDTADGARLHVADSGPPDADVAVIYLHGWCLTSEIYRAQPAALAERGSRARVLRPDLRGHGRSTPAASGGNGIADLGDDIRLVLDELCPRTPAVLVGHSMGGMAIMALAERSPELFAGRVAGVVFVNTSAGDLDAVRAGLVGLADRFLKRRYLPYLFARRSRRGGAPRGARLMDTAIARRVLFGGKVPRADLKLGRRLIATTRPDTQRDFWPELMRHRRYRALGALSAVPVRVLAGTRDRLTPLGHAKRLASGVPGARLLIYPGAGHTIPLERPAELAAEVDRLARPASG